MSTDPHDASSVPDGIDQGLVFAYGEHSVESTYRGLEFGRISEVPSGGRSVSATSPAHPGTKKEDRAGKGTVLSWKW